ncbi:MAG: FAD-dependent oxidoreductase [Spirochaetales bacterium]|nr:FAD-dependent oxidoreductase [Spirochaetales bacterium]
MKDRRGPIESIIMKRLGGNRIQVNQVDRDLPEKIREERSVAVIGGGIAGLTAAAVLAERGLRVTLFEKNDYLGGKVGSWPVRFRDGFETQVEHGFHAFFRQYYNLRGLLERIGAAEYLIPIEDYLISTLDHGNYGFKGIKTTPALNMLSMAKHKVYRLGDMMKNPESRRLLAFLSYDAQKTFEQFDQLSFRQFADQVGLPPQMLIIFATFARAFFAESHLMSMAEMIKSFHFYFLSNDLGLIYDVLRDDFETTFLTPACRYLESRGADIRTGKAVQKLQRRGRGFTAAGRAFDYAVLAADVVGSRSIAGSSGFLQEENPDSFRKLTSLKASQRYSVLRLWTDRALERNLPFFIFTDRIKLLDSISLYHNLEDASAGWAEKSGGGVFELHSYAVPDDVADKGEIRRHFLEELYAYLPELKAAKILYEYHQLRDDFTAFHTGLHRERPTFDPGIDNLYLAGDWVRLPYPAMLMEAAATSALLCANAVLQKEGLRPEAVFSVPLKGLFARR